MGGGVAKVVFIIRYAGICDTPQISALVNIHLRFQVSPRIDIVCQGTIREREREADRELERRGGGGGGGERETETNWDRNRERERERDRDRDRDRERQRQRDRETERVCYLIVRL